MKGTYKIAEKIIEIISLHEKVHEYCKDYRCEGKPDINVVTSQADIDYERVRSAKTDAAEGRTPLESPDDYMEKAAR